ncbi:DNA polymerase III subunit epsilon [Litoribrevibacter albus]|uniref:DNA polymerase III subunit epsilon n=1 Tax=Litoribrevibacter albus TaxID=1473156 RepID=A0AA37SD35_9GAMM|nr:DNA polymerase III subunit epsilon [Litoribrevibacter albus]GLQ32252.1 DNA polymerase III subunit epsilon [Litoribrevibacter albus]
MANRQIVLDTETTGLNAKSGDRIIEIGCVELIDRKLTGNHYHVYINPQRDVPEDAVRVHGITNEFLADKPLFKDVADEFLEYIKGAELVIHNAAFDVGFIEHEYYLLTGKSWDITEYCGVLDTLAMARHKYPGQRATLDALCKRLDVDNSARELHGALLDSEILADVYLAMTGGQTSLGLDADSDSGSDGAGGARRFSRFEQVIDLPVLLASEEELKQHEYCLDLVDKQSDGAVWRK